MKVLVTGGAGFIGSAVVDHLVNNCNVTVINLDKLTYAGSMESLSSVLESKNHIFEQADICDSNALSRIFQRYKPDKVMHLAAESHVDRSIDSPGNFIKTNVMGTYTLLENARKYWGTLTKKNRQQFRFHHVSTDEVYGDLGETEELFSESTPYAPSSPYSASKASSDHLVRAWSRTFNFPVVITNCSNNYGPRQFPEKLIPLTIINALKGKPLPIYGDGKQIRDWLFVSDHAEALTTVMMDGFIGETYNIGGNNEKTNLDVVNELCLVLDKLAPDHPSNIKKYSELITFVPDRPGHDVRYAINSEKILKTLGWKPKETFQTGLLKTVEWYLDNTNWCNTIVKKLHQSYQN